MKDREDIGSWEWFTKQVLTQVKVGIGEVSKRNGDGKQVFYPYFNRSISPPLCSIGNTEVVNLNPYQWSLHSNGGDR